MPKGMNIGSKKPLSCKLFLLVKKKEQTTSDLFRFFPRVSRSLIDNLKLRTRIQNSN